MPETNTQTVDRDQQTKDLLVRMLRENTGKVMTDSGDYYGRHWQQNQVIDFEASPEATFEKYETDVSVTVSVYHFLRACLTLDEKCDEFNAIRCGNWDSDIYGVGTEGAAWLEAHGAKLGKVYNTYNGESDLSQSLQYEYVMFDGEDDEEEATHVLLQIHGGCDAMHGYTDAKLFKFKENRFGSSDSRYMFGYQNVNVSLEVTNDGKTQSFDKSGPGSDWVESESGSSADMPIDDNSQIAVYASFDI
jgi:hypothetical protein